MTIKNVENELKTINFSDYATSNGIGTLTVKTQNISAYVECEEIIAENGYITCIYEMDEIFKIKLNENTDYEVSTVDGVRVILKEV